MRTEMDNKWHSKTVSLGLNAEMYFAEMHFFALCKNGKISRKLSKRACNGSFELMFRKETVFIDGRGIIFSFIHD